jgi:hypothetical protein
VSGRGRAGGTLLSAAFRFLRKAKRRQRAGRLPHNQRVHLFRGDVRPATPTAPGRGSGYHYRPGGQDFPDRRIVPGSEYRPTPNGPYTARPQYLDRSTNPPTWVPKSGNQGVSTFFPDHWTPAQVDAAIPTAFQNATPIPGTNRWEGMYRGVRIEGWYAPGGGLGNGWPTL